MATPPHQPSSELTINRCSDMLSCSCCCTPCCGCKCGDCFRTCSDKCGDVCTSVEKVCSVFSFSDCLDAICDCCEVWIQLFNECDR